jgi:hypothetical protein
MTPQQKIDEAANNYNKTKDPYYKNLWYKLIKEYVNGTNYFKRRTVSINSCHKADDGTYVFIGTSRLHGPVRDTKTKINRIRRYNKSTHHE